jgi:NADH-quinone oxidoreductase subunit L
VGLCSFLLIGHWYRNWDNASAARKAFIVTRIGDAAFMLGLILIVTQLNTLNISQVLSKAPDAWGKGSATAIVVAALLLGGAVGKSAQLPLHTWLPDAMAGPSPVSALIHAATMVTAGVYLIARTHTLFTLAPPVLLAVSIIGAATLIYSSFAALGQTDIKRVLAYSTISQIGYMFVALGVSAWGAAIFHLMTHAFFKAVLFLSAGVVIEAMGGEHDIRKMGGLRKKLPITFWSFLIGSASLAAIPLITAGFFSKELVIDETLASPLGSWWLWAIAAAGTALTALYIFRVVFLVFFGRPVEEYGAAPTGGGHGAQGAEPSRWLRDALPLEAVALVALSVLAILGGLVDGPLFLKGPQWFTEFVGSVLPVPEEAYVPALIVDLLAPALGLLGIVWAWTLYRSRHQLPYFSTDPEGRTVAAFFRAGWGFDWLYDRLFVRPYVWVSRVARGDPIDSGVTGLVWLNRTGWRLLSGTQSGLVRVYAAGAGIGFAALIIIVAVLR